MKMMAMEKRRSRFFMPDPMSFFKRLAILIEGRDARPEIQIVEEVEK